MVLCVHFRIIDRFIFCVDTSEPIFSYYRSFSMNVILRNTLFLRIGKSRLLWFRDSHGGGRFDISPRQQSITLYNYELWTVIHMLWLLSQGITVGSICDLVVTEEYDYITSRTSSSYLPTSVLFLAPFKYVVNYS